MDTMQILDTEAIRQAKIELAATCRWAARLGFQSGVCNHFSVAVPGRPDLMLINPEGYFWSEVTVSSLVMATHDGTIVSTNGHTVELTAFCIHAPIHRILPQATAALHTHMHHATAICTRKGVVVERYQDAAVGYLEKNAAGKLAVTRVELHPRIEFGTGGAPDAATLAGLHDQAHHGCFIANSVHTQVTVIPAS